MLSDKDFFCELDFFIEKIKNKEHFALTRYGDGELLIIKNMIVGNHTQAKKVDNWSFSGQKLICEDINCTLNNNYDNYYYGIPCPCCNKWAYKEYINLLNCNNKNITYANIFVNGNYSRWMQHAENIIYKSICICNVNGENNNIKKMAKEIYYVQNDCANWYENNKNNIIKNFYNLSKNKNDEIFLISAGPLSEIIIHHMYAANNKNIYIDVGSSLDIFIHGKKTRKYHIENSARHIQKCNFND